MSAQKFRQFEMNLDSAGFVLGAALELVALLDAAASAQ